MYQFCKTNILFYLLAALITLSGCTNSDTLGKPTLTVSIPPQKYLLQKIVGNRFEINSLLAPGTDPETYDPSMNHMMSMQKSSAYFKIGYLGFEEASIQKINENFPDLKIYDTSIGIQLIKGTHGHDEFDPHIWLSVKNAKLIAANMFKAVIEIDPKNKKYYANRYKTLKSELNSLDDSIHSLLSKCHHKAFVVWHPSLSYYARDYGLTQISIESEGKEISAKRIESKLVTAKQFMPKVFFYQKEYDSRQSQLIAEQLGSKLIDVNLMSFDWNIEMLKIAHALVSTQND